jgi:hypothetical protein
MTSGRLKKKWEVSLNIEVGYTVFEAGALVDEERELSVSGVWGTLSLGIGTLL